ncbi:hypothetical protein CERSUDRAFT_80267 [Gelatoporia subvermispora B]|uniref:Uncharacterized protein n=1 Tax=Ceriporiopsis subvermispora (strain B) TaxID=914234 RepID=M2PV14_CERS8|nr:hypothetical protein CERSUDRAFT_80267 [Gelatoporia subvermispora B]
MHGPAYGAGILERDLFGGLTGVLGGNGDSQSNGQSKSQSNSNNPLSDPLNIPLLSASDPLGLGQLTSAVGSVLNPITAPLLGTSSSASPTSSSASSTIILTSSTPSSSSTHSSSSASSSVTPSSSPTPTPTPSNTPAPDAAAQPSDTSLSQMYATATVFAPSSETPSASAVTTGKSFLQNKPLSISVITIGSILALVVLFSVATLAIRKRKRDKLQFDAAEFAGEDMFKPTPSAASSDLEKAGLSPGVRKDSWTGSNESGSSGASTQRSLSGQSRSNGGRDMYERAAYQAPPALSPQQPRQGYPAPNYAQPMQAYPNRGPSPAPPAGPPMPAYMAAPFEQSYHLNVNVPEPSLVNFDDNSAYDGLAYAISTPPPAPVPGPGVRPAGRKQLPPLHVMNTTPVTSPNPMDVSPLSLNTSPMLPTNPVNPGNPPASPMDLGGSGARASSQGASHSRELDPTLPPLPVAQSLPDEFGRTSPPTEKKERRLTIRNE